MTVGGRTSAVVPSRQKKTAAVAGDVDSEDLDDAESKPQKGRKRKSTADEGDDAVKALTKTGGRGRTKKEEANGVKHEEDEAEIDGGGMAEAKPPAKKAKSNKATPKKAAVETTPSSGSRRSTRNKAN